MANTRRKGSMLGQKEVGNEFLPLTVRIITIDGKRMTPAFYKQLTSEDLIDESTGNLHGIALGYFHLHTKECPDVPHKHGPVGNRDKVTPRDDCVSL